MPREVTKKRRSIQNHYRYIKLEFQYPDASGRQDKELS
jgi:hypothetical protein